MKRTRSQWQEIYQQWLRQLQQATIPLTNQLHPEEWRHLKRRLPQLCQRYGKGTIHEFGAGSCSVAGYLTQQGYTVRAYDQVALTAQFAQIWQVPFQQFDMQHPPESFLLKGTALTVCSMEQLTHWKPFFAYLHRYFQRIIHVEPFRALCHPSDCQRSRRNHRRHHMVEGYDQYLLGSPQVHLIHTQHVSVGHRFHAYSEMIWEPLPS
ncbi:hypothetical protein HY496_01035 [Candidatus Woesearchaeota archaeon]|nr:hypothetical protein [Candidatus Woesearchaeota archaeon]